nr:MAG TPA: hypothetical protein [Caudoviricetes sp.]
MTISYPSVYNRGAGRTCDDAVVERDSRRKKKARWMICS